MNDSYLTDNYYCTTYISACHGKSINALAAARGQQYLINYNQSNTSIRGMNSACTEDIRNPIIQQEFNRGWHPE